MSGFAPRSRGVVSGDVVPLHFYDECVGSTQNVARELLAGGEAPPFAVHAKEQGVGKGTNDRTWYR